MSQGREFNLDLAKFVEEWVDIVITRYRKLAISLKSGKQVISFLTQTSFGIKKNIFASQYVSVNSQCGFILMPVDINSI